MVVPLQIRLQNNPLLHQYLTEHAYWYKSLNRNPQSIVALEEEMKEHYRLRPSDKINRLSEQLNLIQTFMKMLG